jgi:hypothetical protein
MARLLVAQAPASSVVKAEMYTTGHWLQSKHRMKVPAPKNNRTQVEYLSTFYHVNRRPHDHSLW